jgi:hypothetical protein
MKRIGKLIMMFGLWVSTFACKKEEVDLVGSEKSKNNLKISAGIIGKWSPTYLSLIDGKWQTINTFAALPEIEFTIEGKFLSDGKPGADCCGFVGNKYSITENKIKFSDFKYCPEAACIAIVCEGWIAESIKNDTLTLTDCFATSKYVKIK